VQHFRSERKTRPGLTPTNIEEILKSYKTVAVVGLSRSPNKISHQVAKYLQDQGYMIVVINPTADQILGKKAYKSLLDLPPETQKSLEIIDIFRPSKRVLSIIDQAIKMKEKYGKPYVVWMQLGITNGEAAEKAKKAGLIVVMNKCVMMEHGRLFGEERELEKIRAKKMQELTEKMDPAEKTSTPIKVTDANFDETIKKLSLIVIDCWAAWCGPCRMISPIIDELAREYAGEIVFGKLNVDENPETATRFNVMGVPTLLVMKDGVEVDRLVGVAPKTVIESRLKKHI